MPYPPSAWHDGGVYAVPSVSVPLTTPANHQKLRFVPIWYGSAAVPATGWLRGCDNRLGQHHKQPATDALVQHRKQRIRAFCARNFRLLRFGQRRIGVMGRNESALPPALNASSSIAESSSAVGSASICACTANTASSGTAPSAKASSEDSVVLFGRAFGRILICIASCALTDAASVAPCARWFCSRQRPCPAILPRKPHNRKPDTSAPYKSPKNTDQLCFHLFFSFEPRTFTNSYIPNMHLGTPTQSAILY